MPGIWERLFDYFTRIDDILRETLDEYKKGNARLIEAITGIEPEPDIPRRHIPFYSEGTIVAGTNTVLYVKDDDEQGLGAVGRSGFIINDGAGTIHVIISDGEGKSKDIRIGSGETLEFERGDDVWVDTVTLSCTVGSNAYRCLFSR